MLAPLHHSLPLSELLQLSSFRFILKKKKVGGGIGEDKEIANDILFSLGCDLENAWINYQFFFRRENSHTDLDFWLLWKMESPGILPGTTHHCWVGVRMYLLVGNRPHRSLQSWAWCLCSFPCFRQPWAPVPGMQKTVSQIEMNHETTVWRDSLNSCKKQKISWSVVLIWVQEGGDNTESVATAPILQSRTWQDLGPSLKST